MRVDCFNGDADGLCAIHIWRLHRGEADLTITGVKRDIELAKQIPYSAEEINIFDVSHRVNAKALEPFHAKRANIHYFDHHKHDDLSRLSDAYIDTDPGICTAMIVNQHFDQLHDDWAITAAYGDNLYQSAAAIAPMIPDQQRDVLRELGTLLNYNGYGDELSDLLMEPLDLYSAMAGHDSALEFALEHDSVSRLREGFAEDQAHAAAISPLECSDNIQAFLLPDQRWSRRISGTFANAKAREFPNRATAVITPDTRGTLTVSIRAPINAPVGAAELAQQFPQGGGRAAAAGINQLSNDQLDSLLTKMKSTFT